MLTSPCSGCDQVQRPCRIRLRLPRASGDLGRRACRRRSSSPPSAYPADHDVVPVAGRASSCHSRRMRSRSDGVRRRSTMAAVPPSCDPAGQQLRQVGAAGQVRIDVSAHAHAVGAGAIHLRQGFRGLAPVALADDRQVRGLHAGSRRWRRRRSPRRRRRADGPRSCACASRRPGRSARRLRPGRSARRPGVGDGRVHQAGRQADRALVERRSSSACMRRISSGVGCRFA